MENYKIKIIFMGTPLFGAIVLEKLCQTEFRPILIITETDKPSGRKKIITPPPVKITGQKYDIPVEQPERIKNCKLKIENLQPDLVVVAAYGQILPKEILDIPKYGCLNVHPSFLPKYRGATPVQSAILNGEKEIGATIILMDEGIDTGPILSQNKTIIGPNETSQELHDRLAILGAELLIDAIPNWLGGRIKLLPQNNDKATYTKILTREDGKIDLRKSPQELDRQIRAFNPWPGAYIIHKNKRVKILKAKLEKNKLLIEAVQPEGKTPMAFEDFKRGYPNFHFYDI